MNKHLLVLSLLVAAALAAPKDPLRQRQQVEQDQFDAPHGQDRPQDEEDSQGHSQLQQQQTKTQVESRRCVEDSSECHFDEEAVYDNEGFCTDPKDYYYCSVVKETDQRNQSDEQEEQEPECECRQINQCNSEDGYEVNFGFDGLECSSNEGYPCCRVTQRHQNNQEQEQEQENEGSEHEGEQEEGSHNSNDDEDRKKRQVDDPFAFQRQQQFDQQQFDQQQGQQQFGQQFDNQQFDQQNNFANFQSASSGVVLEEAPAEESVCDCFDLPQGDTCDLYQDALEDSEHYCGPPERPLCCYPSRRRRAAQEDDFDANEDNTGDDADETEEDDNAGEHSRPNRPNRPVTIPDNERPPPPSHRPGGNRPGGNRPGGSHRPGGNRPGQGSEGSEGTTDEGTQQAVPLPDSVDNN